MSQRKYRLDVCPECKVREGVSSRKRVYQCSYCGRWFCKRHLDPRLVNIPDFKRIIQDVSWQNLIEKEWRKKDAHPDFQYTKERWQELRFEKELTWAKIEAFLDGSRGYGKPVSIKPQRENKCQVCGKKLDLPFRCSYCQEYFCVDHKLPENHQCPDLPREPLFWHQKRKIAEKQVPTYPSTHLSSVQKRSRKVKVTILAISLVTILIIASLFLSGILEFNIGIPLIPSEKDTTISRVILEQISMFEDQKCRRPVQTIDWGYVESNHSYSKTFYARNDYAINDWDDRDIHWQRLNVNPSSVYISVKCNYGGKQIRPNEVRQVTITLTVLGLFDSSGKLNPDAEIPQFTFDLKLIGKWLNIFSYVYIRTYANREANNITLVYKDDLKETISVFMEVRAMYDNKNNTFLGEKLVWNSTKYAHEFSETWLNADIYTDYVIRVTINHERYGELHWKNVLGGQFP